MTLDLCTFRRGGAAAPVKCLVCAFMLALACAFTGVAAVGKDKSPIQYQIPLPNPPDFSAIDWLIGEWTGATVGKSPPGKVRLSASLDLQKQFLVLREEVALDATGTAPAAKETWMGILCPDAGVGGFVLRVFSSTGFVTRYRVRVDGAQVHLNPDGGERPPADWLFRTTLERTGPGEFTQTVQAAPPNKAFFEYYSAHLTRVSSSAKPNPAP